MPPTYSTTLFPDLIGQGYKRYRLYQAIHSDLATAGDQTADLTGIRGALWVYELSWDGMTLYTTDAQQLWHAAEFMAGDVLSMAYFDWISRAYSDAFVATADGVARAWDLPGKAISGLTLEVNGGGVAATLGVATGADGRDRATLGGAVATPALGAVIRASFTGRFARTMRFVDNSAFQMATVPKSSPLRWTASANLVETVAWDSL